MFTLNEIDPLSYGKIQAVMWLIAGLVLGVIGSLLILALGPSVVRFLSNRYANAISGYSLASLARLIPAFAVLLPVIGILGGALIGFLAGVINGFLYNFSASKVGGVKLDLTKDRRTLAHVEPMSSAKVLAIMIGVFGAISGALVGAVSGSLGGGALSLLGLIAGALLGIIIGAIFGFIIGLIYAALYDIIAERFGGIRIELSKDTKQLNRIDVISYAKVLAIFGLIFGFISGIAHGLIRASYSSAALVLLLVLGYPIYEAIIQFICGAIIAVLYNFASGRIGGVKIKLAQTQ